MVFFVGFVASGTSCSNNAANDRIESRIPNAKFLIPNSNCPYLIGKIFSRSSAGRGITWTPISSPTRRAAAAPASVAALTDPTSPRTIAVTRPASTFCQPTKTTLAVFTIASAASIMPINPRVSTIPRASPTSGRSLSAMGLRLLNSSSRGNGHRVDDTIAFDEPHDIHQIRDDARVVRHDADTSAGDQMRAARNPYRGVLFGQPLDGQRLVDLWRRVAVGLDDGAEAGCTGDAARLIVGERLAAAIEDDPVGGGRRHHGRGDRERTVVERGGTERNLRAIEVDVVAGPQLGQSAQRRAES